MLYMLDTNICIYLINRRSNELLNRLRAFRTGEIGVSVVTVAELQYGVSKSDWQMYWFNPSPNDELIDHVAV